MRRKVEKKFFTRLINCGEVVVISCGYKDKSNLTTCAWCIPISKNPPIIAISLAEKHFSAELIKKSEEFIINICDWSLLDKVVKCGSLSGWNVEDKFKEVGLKKERAYYLTKAFRIKEAIAHLECYLRDYKKVGDHYLFLGEVIYAEAESDFFENNFWNTKKVNLIFHLGSKYFFKSSPFIEINGEKNLPSS